MFLKQQISSFFRFFGLYVPLNCPMCGGDSVRRLAEYVLQRLF